MYSANVWSDPKLYLSHFGATVCYDDFLESLQRRAAGANVVFPAEVEEALLETTEAGLETLRDLVISHRLAQIRLANEEIELREQRLADATQRLALEPSRTGRNTLRTLKRKIAAARRRREALVLGTQDSQVCRMFPGTYVPILVMHEGVLEVKPMRYQCRPSHVDRRVETLLVTPHHARRDSLAGTWRREFGRTHGLIAAESLFDAVSLHRMHRREVAKGEQLAALELEFLPVPSQTLYIPCVWSHWERPGQEDLRSFAVVVDRAPEELQAVGQDWCPVTVKRERVLDWLCPQADDLAACHALLEDRPAIRYHNVPYSPARAQFVRGLMASLETTGKPTRSRSAKANLL